MTHHHDAQTPPRARTATAEVARRGARRAIGLTFLALAAAGLAGLSACSSSHEPRNQPPGAPVESGPYPGPRPDTVPGLQPVPDSPPLVASASPDQVAKVGLEVMFQSYCDRDTGPHAAARRALAYLAPPMSTDVLAAPPVASAGAKWDLWMRHRAVLTSQVTPGNDPTPPDTANRVYRQYQVTQTVRGENGWSAPDETTTVFVTLVRTPEGWRISELVRS